MTYFAEELLEGITAQDVGIRLETGFTKRLLKEFGHLKPHAKELTRLFFLCDRARVRGILGGIETTSTHSCKFVLERRGKHVWEELQGDREQELHKRNHDEDGKRNHSEQVLCRPSKLSVQPW